MSVKWWSSQSLHSPPPHQLALEEHSEPQLLQPPLKLSSIGSNKFPLQE